MNRRYYSIEQIPDLTLTKYASYDNGNVQGVIEAHSHFWRQMNRKGLLYGEAFHLFYEFNPQRAKGDKLRIGICVDSQMEDKSFTDETIAASVLSPYFGLSKLKIRENPDKNDLDVTRKYRYGTHLIKKERFLSAKEYGREAYYLTSEWEMNENARLYTMTKLMAEIDQPCLYVVSIYPREWTAEMTARLDQTLYELRNTVRPQVSTGMGSTGIQIRDEHAKSALDFYEDLLESLAENPHFLVDVQVMSDSLEHACSILDAAASEALQEGTHEQIQFEQYLSLSELSEACFYVCAKKEAPPALNRLPQLFLLEELAHFAILPVLYSGEWIEIAKETVPESHVNGLLLGRDNTGHEIFFPLKNLSKHAFLAGVPGSGKTNAMMHLIYEMHGKHQIPVLIFEPAKHEYRAITRIKDLQDVELFSPSAATRFPLHINPFEFPIGMTLAEHIRNLIAVFDGAFSLDPPMPFLLDASVEEVYTDMGWLPAMTNMDKLDYPTMSQLYSKLAEKLEKTDYGPEIKGNLKSALQVRIGSLITREMADIFDVPESTVKPADWLNRSAIIELESMGKDPANFTTLLIATLIRETLKVVNYEKPKDGRPRHVMFFEEAHNLIGPTAEKVAGQDADPKIAATAYIVKMLAEVRALGEGIIIADQLPTALAPEVIKNTSLKIGLRITAQDDRQLLGGTMNANPDQIEGLSVFIPGHALVSYEPLLKPFEVQLPYFKAKEGEQSDKAVLNCLVPKGLYFKDVQRSLDISKSKWKKKEDQLRKRLKDAILEEEEICAINADESKTFSPQELANLKKRAQKVKEEMKAIRLEAEKLSLQIIAYATMFDFTRNKAFNRFPGVITFKNDLDLAENMTNGLINEVYAAINQYRAAEGASPATKDKFLKKKRMLRESAKSWSEL